jgi:hypothetical protein
MASEQHDGEPFLRLVRSFTADTQPQVVWMTGGEPLLRPQLVAELAETAAERGVRSALLSGMWFATRGPARAVRRALGSVDHVSASIDRWHEAEVPRRAVLNRLGELLADGTGVSVHLVVEGPGDPYLDEAVGEIRAVLDDRCPVIVSALGPHGRARAWAPPGIRGGPAPADPCPQTAWPTVAYDGTVLACCSQLAVDGPVPEHLRLGHAAVDDWEAIASHAVRSPALRAIRTFGPRWLAEQHGARDCGGYCETCLQLGDDRGVAASIEAQMARPGTALLEAHAAGALRRREWQQIPGVEHLLELGRPVAV